MTDELDPKSFDLDAWLQDAQRPQRSVTVYARPDLIADLDALEQKIKLAQDANRLDETGLGEMSPVQALQAAYYELAEEFSRSSLVVRLQGLTSDEQKAIREEAKAAGDDSNEAVGFRMISASLMHPKASVEQAKRLRDKIGEAQYSAIIATYNAACGSFPEVSADFLRKSSGRGAGSR